MSTPVSHPSIGEAAALAARCHVALESIATRGGPGVDEHLRELRRSMARRRTGGPHRRHLGQAITAARSGCPGAVADDDLRALVHHLRHLDRALRHAAAIGVPRPRGDRRPPTTDPDTVDVEAAVSGRVSRRTAD